MHDYVDCWNLYRIFTLFFENMNLHAIVQMLHKNPNGQISVKDDCEKY